MNNAEAKFILQGYRPNGADASDATFQAALEQVQRDPALHEWFARQQAFDGAVSAKLNDLPAPAGLREAILAGGRVTEADPSQVRWWRSPALLAAAAAIAVIFTTTLALWPKQAAAETALAGYVAAFDTTSANLLKGDEIYRTDVRQLTVGSLEKVDAAESSLRKDFETSRKLTEETISSTIFLQETIAGMALEMTLVAAVLLWDSKNCEPKTLRGRLALCGLFCVMPSFAPISWKSYYAAMLLPYMALVAVLWTDRVADQKADRVVWTLFGLSIALNYVPELHWNRLALFYSAHFFSSILTLAALFLLWLRTGSTSHGNAAMLPKRETAVANSVAR